MRELQETTDPIKPRGHNAHNGEILQQTIFGHWPKSKKRCDNKPIKKYTYFSNCFLLTQDKKQIYCFVTWIFSPFCVWWHVSLYQAMILNYDKCCKKKIQEKFMKTARVWKKTARKFLSTSFRACETTCHSIFNQIRQVFNAHQISFLHQISMIQTRSRGKFAHNSKFIHLS